MKSIFKVTRKGIGESIGVADIVPQIIIGLLAFSGVIWGALKLCYGIHGSVKGMVVSVFWNMANGLMVLSVIEKVTRPYYKREEFRFIGAIPVRYSQGRWLEKLQELV